MPVVACPCGKKFRAIDALAGKQVSCPGCGRPLLIPPASLLDEELTRQDRSTLDAAPAPRARIRQRSTAMEGWLLAILVAGGAALVLAIIATLVSMLGGDQSTDDQVVRSAPREQPASGPSVAEPSFDPAMSFEDTPPEFESSSTAVDRSPIIDSPALTSSPEQSTHEPDPTDGNVERPAEDPLPPAELREPAPPNAVRGSDSPTSSKMNSIRLSRGVALAQTLPTGTAMGFSVEYEFIGQAPTGPAKFFWVIQSGKGQVVKQPAQLSARGTLQGFVTQFRPEHAPFSTHIEDYRGNRLTKSLPLR